VSIGRLFKNKIKARLAFYILEPLIDSLRSRRKIYSPLTASMSVYKDIDFRAAILESSRLRLQNLGMKETITVELESVWPKV
jgi:hypothetical protein